MDKGTISTYASGVDLVVEWKIENFFSLPKKDGTYLYSPDFSFSGEKWFMGIFPNGSSGSDSSGHLDLRLWKCSDHSIRQSFSLSLKSIRGEKYNEQHCTKDFGIDYPENYHGLTRFTPRSELMSRKSNLVPEGVLTVLCTMKSSTSAGSATIGNLLQDFKRLLLSGEHSDVTVTVRGEEFRLHRNILGVRNPFFHSRFNNESQVTTPATLFIDNCDPDQFRTLIHYIYTGTADNLAPENVCGLYEVAVAYQEPQMRAECLQFMMNNLSVDNFCDYTVLAVKHNQEELLQKAIKLFVRKVKEITRQEKWEAFLQTYPAQANKLYMIALDQYDEK